MAELLTNVAVSDAYSSQATLGPTLGITQLVFQVFNEPVYARFFKPPVDPESNRQPTLDPTEHYFPVGTLLSVDGAAGVQFRNAIAGQPATINAQIGFAGDPIFDFQSSGLFSAAVLTLSFLHNSSLIGAESALDFEDSSSIVWSVVDTPGTKEAVSASFVSGSVVTSVFGRSGPAVVAQTGDYTAAQVTNAADKSSASQQLFTGQVATGGGSLAVGAAAGTVLGTTGTVASAVASTAGRCFSATVTGDTTSFRWNVLGDGTLQWGGGAGSAVDLNLSRISASFLGIGTGAAGAIGGTLTNGPGFGGFTGTQTQGQLFAPTIARFFGTSAGSAALTVGLTTDTQPEFQFTYGGSLSWGTGSAAVDVILQRMAIGSTGLLKLTGSAAANGSLQADGNLFAGFQTSALAATATYTPNALNAYTQTITQATGGGTLTIANPTNPPASAAHTGEINLILQAAATSGTTLSWGTQYVGTTATPLPTTIAAASITALRFLADYTTGSILWRLVNKG